MKSITGSFLLLITAYSYGQEPILRPGNQFPDLLITNISNAPVKEIYLAKNRDNKFYILNFWGTWCSPCIPEMDALAQLQKNNAGKLQVVGISDDDEERKSRYLKSKPSSLWLATDTAYIIYRMLNLSSVGNSVIINPERKIVAVVRTDSINQQMIAKLFSGEAVMMSAGLKESAIQTDSDMMSVDSLTEHNFTLRGYKKGQPAMSRLYLQGPFRDRRLTWWNATIDRLYRDAFGIHSYRKQEMLDASVNEQEVFAHDMKDTRSMYCVDLLVGPQQKDSLYILLQQYLNLYLPVKARLEKRKIEVYVLKQKPGTPLAIQPSTAERSTYGFSGRGYEGMRVTLEEFAAGYLTNELGIPVTDETGLAGYYDIKTNVELRTVENIRKSIETLGLMIQKAKREMDVIVYYK